MFFYFRHSSSEGKVIAIVKVEVTRLGVVGEMTGYRPNAPQFNQLLEKATEEISDEAIANAVASMQLPF